MSRMVGPSAAPSNVIRLLKSYRHAVRFAWEKRRLPLSTRMHLAAEAELYYLNEDDNPSRRSLPADKIPGFETFVGNTIVSQWLAAQAKLTVMEEMQADKQAQIHQIESQLAALKAA